MTIFDESMNQNTVVKAPGKILWIGVYSVLERPNVSYVTSVDAYVTATVEALDTHDVEIIAPQLGMSAKGKINSNGAIELQVPKELLLLKTAVQVASRYSVCLGKKVGGFRITTLSDPQFAYSISKGNVIKSGLGTSAAVTVSAIAAILRSMDISLEEKDALHKLSQLSHSIATGKVGSGFDIAAATYGSIVYSRYSPEIISGFPQNYSDKQLLDIVDMDWDYSIEKLAFPKKFRILFANFGESMITRDAVSKVMEFKKFDPRIYFGIMGEVNEYNVKAVDSLKRLGKKDASALEDFRQAFEHSRSLIKKLGAISNVGIEPDDCTHLINESKSNGAFVARLPGAGGKDSIAAICLDAKSYASLKKFWKSKSELKILDVKTTDNGVL